MILMEDKKLQHQSLIKITKRVFSHDYVPAEVFTAQWLYEHYPYEEPVEEPTMDEVDFEMFEDMIEEARE
jgi:hypothetical protein